MRKILVPIACACMLASTFPSCKKDYQSGEGTYSLASVFSSLQVQSKITTINASTGGSITGNSGSRYIVPANAFKDASGNVVTGNVQVETKDYVKRSDMIFSGVMPITATEPLMSGGETYVNATQNGQQLSLDPTKTYQVNMPQTKTPPSGLRVFTGVQDPTTNTVSWSFDSTNSMASIVTNGDTVSMITNNMHFCNADAFMVSPNWQTFTVTVSASGATISANIGFLLYAVYDNYNGVWPMGNITNNVATEDHVPNIPVHFLALTVINGNLYAGILGATPSTGSNYNVVMTKTTPAELKANIDAL